LAVSDPHVKSRIGTTISMLTGKDDKDAACARAETCHVMNSKKEKGDFNTRILENLKTNVEVREISRHKHICIKKKSTFKIAAQERSGISFPKSHPIFPTPKQKKLALSTKFPHTNSKM
jgi:hypothetical protein